MAKTLSFEAQMSSWAEATLARQRAIFQESVQRLIEVMQTPVGAGGNMPVDTGFLRASLRIALGPSSYQEIANTGKTKVTYDDAVTILTLANAKIGDVISIRYIANYAWRIEEGFVGTDAAGRSYNQPGRGFVKLAAQRWPQIVRQVCRDARKGSKP